MKKDATVIAAEKARDEKAAELAAAREVVKRLEAEHAQAVNAIRLAQEAIDANLPQCRLVRVRSHSGKEEDSGMVVIERRTPTGILVVRKAGDASGSTSKFKWSKYSGGYVQAEKRTVFSSDRRELRDVPAEYMTDSSAA